MNKLFPLLLLFLSFSIHAWESPEFEKDWDVHLKFGGWSHHQDSDVFGHYDFNESHNGIGIQAWKGIVGSKWHVGAEVFHMKDSFSQPATMISVSSKYEFIFDNKVLTHIDLLAGITVHDRSFIHHYYHRSDGEVIIAHSDIYRDVAVAPSLMLTARWFDRFDVDITHYPEFSTNHYSVTFIRFGLKI